MRRFSVILLLLALALGGYRAILRPARAAPRQGPLFLNIGDSVQVSGAPLGCRVISPNGVKTLDCRVAGSLAGSFGTLMSGRRLQVVRFRNGNVAKVVFVATQHGGYRLCR